MNVTAHRSTIQSPTRTTIADVRVMIKRIGVAAPGLCHRDANRKLFLKI
jgi:hypothetical protein